MDSRSLVLGTAANVVGTGLSVIATLFLARMMPPEEFGAYRVGITTTTMFLPFLMMGAERYASKVIQEGDTAVLQFVIRTCALSLLGGTLVLLLMMGPIRERVLGGSLPPATFALALLMILPMGLYNLGNTIWRHCADTTRPQVHQFLVQRTVKSTLALAAAAVSRQSAGVLAVTLVAQIGLMISSWRHLRDWRATLSDAPLSRARRLASLRAMAMIGLPLLLFGLFERLDVLLISGAQGAAAAGAFDLALLVGFVAIYPMMSLVKTTEPFLRACRDDPARRVALHRLIRRATLMSLGVTLAIALGGTQIDRFIAPAGASVGQLALLIALGMVGAGATGPAMEYLQITGRLRQVNLTLLLLGPPVIGLKLVLARHAPLEVVAASLGGALLLFKYAMCAYVWRADRLLLADLPSAALALAAFAAACVGLLT